MNRLKSTFAMAAALLGCAADAQTSVNMYGLMDAFVGEVKGQVTGVNVTDRRGTVVNGGTLSTSHWGLRGSEELGGGSTAFFDLSSFIRNDTGSQGRSDAIGAPVNVGADPFFSRSSFVGLRNNAWGAIRLGNIPTPMLVSTVASNALGDSMALSPLRLVTFVGGPLTGGTAWTDQLAYDSPTRGGISFNLAGALSEKRGGANFGGRVGYAREPLIVSVTWQSVKKNPLTFADGTSPNDTKAVLVAGSYDFGVVRLFAHVGQIKNLGTAALPLDINYTVWEMSLAVPIGAGRLLAGYANRSTDDAVLPEPATVPGGNIKRRVATLAYDHHLSKRTDVYIAAMGDLTVTRTLPAPGSKVSATGSTFGVGIRHRF